MSGWVAGATIGSGLLSVGGSIFGSKKKAKAERAAREAQERQARQNRLDSILFGWGAHTEQEARDRMATIGNTVDQLTALRHKYSPQQLLDSAKSAYDPLRGAFAQQTSDLAERARTGNLDERLRYLAPLLSANIGQASAEGRQAELAGKHHLASLLSNNALRGANVVSGVGLGQVGRAKARIDSAADLSMASAAAKNAGLMQSLQEQALADRQGTDLLALAQRGANFNTGAITDAMSQYANLVNRNYAPLAFLNRQPIPTNVDYKPIESPSVVGSLMGTAGNTIGQLGGLYAMGAFGNKGGGGFANNYGKGNLGMGQMSSLSGMGSSQLFANPTFGG